jgi:hypothetical protein
LNNFQRKKNERQFQFSSIFVCFSFVFSRSDSDTNKISIDGNNAKKDRSGSHPKLEDETEKQLEMQLLDSSPPEAKIKQPKTKEVTIVLFISFILLKLLINPLSIFFFFFPSYHQYISIYIFSNTVL